MTQKLHRRPFSLMVEFYNRAFQFADISVNEVTEEFFYSFIRRDMKLPHTARIGDIDDNIIDEFKCGWIEHISFHGDGSVHVRMKKQGASKPSYIQTHNLPENILDFVNKNGFIPILIDSIFLVDGTYDLLKTSYSKKRGNPFVRDKTGNICGYIWSLKEKMNFSVVILLAPQSFDNLDLLRRDPRIKKIMYSYKSQTPAAVDLLKGVKAIAILSHLSATQPLNPTKKVNDGDSDMTHRGFVIGPTWDHIMHMRT